MQTKLSKWKRILSILLSLLLIIAFQFSVNMRIALADEPGDPGGGGGADAGKVTFTCGEGGSLQYSLNDASSFTDVPGTLEASSLSEVTKIYLKATPSDGKKIDTNQHRIFIDGTDSTLSEEGLLDGSCCFDYSIASTYHIEISFESEGGGSPGGVGGADAGKVTFTCGEGGSLQYSLNDASSFTDVPGTLEASSLSEVTKIYLKATPSDGKKIDTNQHRIFIDGTDSILSEEGLLDGSCCFDYSIASTYHVEISFESEGGGSPGGGGGAGIGSGDVEFRINGNGTTTYKTTGESFSSIPGGDMLHPSDIGEVTTVYIKAAPSEGKILGYCSISESGSSPVAISNDQLLAGTYSFSYDSGKTYSINIEYVSDPSYVGGSGNITLNLSGCVNGSNTGKSAFGSLKFNGTDVADGENVLVEGNTSGADNTLFVQAEYLMTISSLKIDNVPIDLSSYNPEIGMNISLAPKASYTISATFASTGQHTIVWAYNASDFGPDAYVSGGKVEVVSVNGGTPNGTSGHITVSDGATVVVRLIPDYGKQVVGAKINGEVDLTANAASNEFSFEMPPTNVHFQGIFTDTADIVSNSASTIANASFTGNAVASTGGTAKMTISNASPANIAQVTESIDTTKSVQAVNITMDQIFYKNTPSEVWSTNKTELASAAEVMLTVNQSAGDYLVLREHNGVVEKIDSNYDSSNNTITFSSNKYSTYTLVPLVSKDSSPHATNDVSYSEKTSKSDDSEVIESPKSETETTASVPVEKPMNENVDGKVINSWNDLDTLLVAKSVAKASEGKASTTTSNTVVEIIQLKLNNTNSTIPTSTIANVSKTNYTCLHLFTGNGTAVTLINDSNLNKQKAVNLSCTTTIVGNVKTIVFNSPTTLEATTLLHTTVPAGTKNISVYFTGSGQTRVKIAELSPTNDGKVCFPIKATGKFEIVY